VILQEGAIPNTFARLGVFHWVPEAPPEAQLYHYLFLNNNELWTEIPGYMLEAIAIPGEGRAVHGMKFMA
jgi:hypothetical protein